jgi:sulfhydrogenase subunit delta
VAVATTIRPALAVWKFASCDGCQLSLLDCEDELLAVAGEVRIAHFLEASTGGGRRTLRPVPGRGLGHDAGRPWSGSSRIRSMSRRLVTIGACATAGGVQALRDIADVEEYLSIVYARPDHIATLADSTPIAAHVAVDFELRGCPIDRRQLLEVLSAFLHDRRPEIPGHSVCVECKAAGNVCVTVAHGTPCLGPVTHAGCGALCPSYHRGCYGCFGPMETPNVASLASCAGGGRAPRLSTWCAAAHVQRRGAGVPGRERGPGRAACPTAGVPVSLSQEPAARQPSRDGPPMPPRARTRGRCGSMRWRGWRARVRCTSR